MKGKNRVIVLIGVSGSGKTTVGRLLSEELGWKYYEGDDFHPQPNIEKMKFHWMMPIESRGWKLSVT